MPRPLVGTDAVVITAGEMDDALQSCAICGGRLREDDDTVHSRLTDCRGLEQPPAPELRGYSK